MNWIMLIAIISSFIAGFYTGWSIRKNYVLEKEIADWEIAHRNIERIEADNRPVMNPNDNDWSMP
jgi:hypothetical protein